MTIPLPRTSWYFVPALVAAVASAADGQAVSGRVVDSTTRAPLAGVTVTLLSGSTAASSTRSNDSGYFELRAPAPGDYTLQLRLLGHSPRVLSIPLRQGDGLNLQVALLSIPTALDTVLTQADRPPPSLLGVTLGRDVYRRHMERGIGQFVTGFEIQRAKMPLLAYLGTIPGLRVATSVPIPDTRGDAPNSPPTLLDRHGNYLLSTADGWGCLYARIDHWALPNLFAAYNTIYLDDVVEVEDIMGVEVYQPGENPPEWQFEGMQSLRIVTQDFIAYFVGSTRMSLKPIRSADMSRRTRLRIPPNDLFVVHDVPWMSPPKCAFVQIWTRISW